MHLINEIIFWTACGMLWIVLAFWLCSRIGKFMHDVDVDSERLTKERSVSNG